MGWVARRCGLIGLVLLPGIAYFVAAVVLVESSPYFAREHQGGQLWCERRYLVEESIMCQPSNGLTSFAYALTPVMMVWAWDSGRLSERVSYFGKPSAENILVALVGMYQVIGNLAFHGFCNPHGMYWDVTSMLLIVGLFFSQILSRVCCNSRAVFWVVFSVHAFMSFFGVWHISGSYWTAIGNKSSWDALFGNTLLATLVLSLKPVLCSGRSCCRPFVGWSLFALASLAAGLYLHEMHECNPTSPWQRHAAWHLLTGVSSWAMWQSYRSDEELLPKRLLPPTTVNMDSQELTSKA